MTAAGCCSKRFFVVLMRVRLLLRGFWLKQPMKRSAAGIGIAAAVVVAAAAATRVAHAVIAAAAPDDDQQDDDPAAVSPTKAVIAHNRKPPMKT